MPSRRWRVVCGRLEVMLTLAPTSALTSVDLPTLGRPMTATWPARIGLCVVVDGAALRKCWCRVEPLQGALRRRPVRRRGGSCPRLRSRSGRVGQRAADAEASWRGRRRFLDAARTPAAAAAAPAAIPAAGSWRPCRPCAAAAAPPSAARTRAARPRGRLRSRHRGRSRRPRPPARRPGSNRGDGRRSSFRRGPASAARRGPVRGRRGQRGFAHQLGAGAGQRAFVGLAASAGRALRRRSG